MNQPSRARRKRPPMLAPTAIPTLAPVERPGAGSDADAEVEVEVDDVSLVDVAVDVWVVEDYRLGRELLAAYHKKEESSPRTKMEEELGSNGAGNSNRAE